MLVKLESSWSNLLIKELSEFTVFLLLLLQQRNCPRVTMHQLDLLWADSQEVLTSGKQMNHTRAVAVNKFLFKIFSYTNHG